MRGSITLVMAKAGPLCLLLIDDRGAIVWLRKHYHFGPAKIAMYLQRYHDVQVSKSEVWRILQRLDMNPLAASPTGPLGQLNL